MSQKKRLFAVAALSMASAAAMAQTSVSLYGIVDAAVRSESTVTAGTNGGHVKGLAAGGMSQSRLGVNISEDMGDGWRAVANIEHRLMSDTGAQSSASDFWRQAWVGLITPVGRITLGRQYNVLFDLTTSTFAAYKYSPYVEQFKPELGLSVGNRQSNMVKYALSQGAFTMEAQISAGEGTGDKTIGGMARYQMGGFAFGAGMLNAKDPAGKQVKGTVFGAGYNAGPLYLNLGYGKNKFDAGFSPALIVGYFILAPPDAGRDRDAHGGLHRLHAVPVRGRPGDQPAGPGRHAGAARRSCARTWAWTRPFPVQFAPSSAMRCRASSASACAGPQGLDADRRALPGHAGAGAGRGRHRAGGGHSAGRLCRAAARPVHWSQLVMPCRCWACRCPPS
jgi:hypothetical protein